MPLIEKLSSFPRPVYVAGACIWAGVIMALLLAPGDSVPRIGIPHADKAVHAGLFFILAYFVWNALRSARGRKLLATFLIVSSYGIATELIQKMAAARTADIFDAAADIAGAALYVAVIWRSSSRRP